MTHRWLHFCTGGGSADVSAIFIHVWGEQWTWNRLHLPHLYLLTYLRWEEQWLIIVLIDHCVQTLEDNEDTQRTTDASEWETHTCNQLNPVKPEVLPELQSVRNTASTRSMSTGLWVLSLCGLYQGQDSGPTLGESSVSCWPLSRCDITKLRRAAFPLRAQRRREINRFEHDFIFLETWQKNRSRFDFS